MSSAHGSVYHMIVPKCFATCPRVQPLLFNNGFSVDIWTLYQPDEILNKETLFGYNIPYAIAPCLYGHKGGIIRTNILSGPPLGESLSYHTRSLLHQPDIVSYLPLVFFY